MPRNSLDYRTCAIVVPLSATERRRLEAWALIQERECSQAIRFLLRDILQADHSPPDWHPRKESREIRNSARVHEGPPVLVEGPTEASLEPLITA
jgi:hypothetical protein